MISFFGIHLIVISLLVAIDGQQFCESYVNNSYKVLVHSPDNRVLTLVVDKHFWIVDTNENRSLYFRNNGTSSGSIDFFGRHITTLFYGSTNIIGFYDVRHEYH